MPQLKIGNSFCKKVRSRSRRINSSNRAFSSGVAGWYGIGPSTVGSPWLGGVAPEFIAARFRRSFAIRSTACSLARNRLQTSSGIGLPKPAEIVDDVHPEPLSTCGNKANGERWPHSRINKAYRESYPIRGGVDCGRLVEIARCLAASPDVQTLIDSSLPQSCMGTG